MSSKRELEVKVEQLQQIESIKSQTITELRKETSELQATLDAREQAYQEVVNKLRAENDKLREDAIRELSQLESKLEVANKELAKLRVKSKDVDRYQGYISRLVEPVTRSSIISLYHEEYDCVETVTAFNLKSKSDAQALYAIPKADIRLRRNNGLLSDLLQANEYPDLLEDPGFQNLLPSQIMYTPKFLFGKLLPNGIFVLSDPRTATHVKVWLSATKVALNQWQKDNPTGLIVSEKETKDETAYRDTQIVVPFPGEDRGLELNIEIDQDATKDDLQTLHDQREERLRQICYQRYQNHYFSN